MNKDLTVKEISEIPADILELWGKPPLLPNEDPEAYRKLAVAVANARMPADTIEWLSVRDIVYHYWQIRRAHLFKDELIKIGQYDLSRDYCEKLNITDEDHKRAVKKYFRTSDKGTTMGFRQDAETYEMIGSLLAAEEDRVSALLREFDKRRGGLASHARAHFRVSDDIIDGEFTEPQPVPAASGQGKTGVLVKKGTQISPERLAELMKASFNPGPKKGAA
jgi:hypothetical protein